jgi:hypothetical protein
MGFRRFGAVDSEANDAKESCTSSAMTPKSILGVITTAAECSVHGTSYETIRRIYKQGRRNAELYMR